MNLREQARAKADEIESIWATADEEGRHLSRRERARVEELIDKVKELQGRLKVDEQIRATFGDGLVESGHLIAIEGVDGGYRISDGYNAAVGVAIARKAEAAERN